MSTTYQVKFPGVLRFPRHRESYKLKLWKAEQLATLKAKVWERIRVGQDLAKRGRKANIEIGRALNELKSRVGHGHWKDFYVTNFGSSGIAERTARTWMKMARREPNAISKTAESPFCQSQWLRTLKQSAMPMKKPRPKPKRITTERRESCSSTPCSRT